VPSAAAVQTTQAIAATQPTLLRSTSPPGMDSVGVLVLTAVVVHQGW